MENWCIVRNIFTPDTPADLDWIAEGMGQGVLPYYSDPFKNYRVGGKWQLINMARIMAGRSVTMARAERVNINFANNFVRSFLFPS
jgi:hypothetical protein